MLIDDFRNDSLSMCYAKFAIAIAFDALTGSHSDKSVIYQITEQIMSFKSVGVSDDVASVQKRKENTEFEMKMKSSKTGIVSALITYFYENKVFMVESGSRMFGQKVAVSLSEIGEISFTKETLYQRTMGVLLKYSDNNLVYAYTLTDHFMQAFKKHVKRVDAFSANKTTRNVLTDGTIEEIRHSYSNYVKERSSNGSYNPNTSEGPIGFLKYAYDEFYKKEKAVEFYGILNKRGLDSEVGDGSSTKLDYYGIEGFSVKENIDFKDLCSKINKASWLLYNHGGNKKAFLDIFSNYRDVRIDAKVAEFTKKMSMVKGTQVVYSNDSTYTVFGNVETITTKKNHRMKLARVFEGILTHGLRQEEVFEIYEKCLDITSRTKPKNGCRLFSVDDVTTKNGLSNGEILEILINGFAALRELIAFIESKHNTTGVTIETFPTEIFRDPGMLIRFNTFHSYVTNVGVTSKLVTEVELDVDRRRVQDDNGSLSNETVFDIINNSAFFSSKDNLINKYSQVLMNSSLSFAGEVFGPERSKKLDIDATLSKEVNKVYTSWVKANYASGFTYNDFISKGKEYTDNAFIKIVDTVYKSVKANNTAHRTYLIILINCLRAKMKFYGHSVTDEAGYYALKESKVTEEFSWLYNSPDSTSYDRAAVQLIPWCMNYFGTCSDDEWQDLRNLFYVCDVLEALSISIKEFIESFIWYSKDSYLMYAKAATHREILRLPSKIYQIVELTDLLSGRDVGGSFLLKASIENIAINRARDEVLKKVVNSFLESSEAVVNLFSQLDDRIDEKLVRVGGAKKVNARLEKRLATIATELWQRAVSDNNPERLLSASKLKTVSKFDKLGFVLSGSVRMEYDGLFFHNTGYSVRLNTYAPYTADYTVNVITPMFVENMNIAVLV